MKRYKFLRTGLKSESGDIRWKFGKWRKFVGKLKMCEGGFHCSVEPYDAFSYVQGEILAEVEVGGEHLEKSDKQVWEKMRIIRAWKWQKRNSIELAIFCAELVLPNFEREHPDDKRPRLAIEAAKKVLFKDTARNRKAAGSAAWSAAWRAAWSAARSAGSAARSAGSAESAARSAGSAESATITKIQNKFKEIVRKLEPYQRNQWI